MAVADVERRRALSDALVQRPAAIPFAAVLPAGSRVNESGHLEVGGCDVVSLAEEFGTPAYVYVEDDMRARARAYQDAFAAWTDDFEVLFASKAAPFTAAFRLFEELDLSVDVASGGELAMAIKAGFPPGRIYMHGNNKSRKELDEAFDAGIGHLVVDSLDEIGLADALLDRPQKVLIRITPGIRPRTFSAAQTGQRDTKFGFGLEAGETRAAIEAIKASQHLELVGFHAHVGSQIFDLKTFRREVKALSKLANGNCQVLNVGGGLGIAYLEKDEPPTIEAYVGAVMEEVQNSFDEVPKILVEPGRSLVGAAGLTAYSIGVRKELKGLRTYIGVDGGMSDNMRPMLYGADYEAILANRVLAEPTEKVTVVGKHCETGDNLVEDVWLPEPQVGDILVTPATGAYGHAMANNYNGVPRPPIVFCCDGQPRVVVRREEYEDMTARDVSARDV